MALESHATPQYMTVGSTLRSRTVQTPTESTRSNGRMEGGRTGHRCMPRSFVTGPGHRARSPTQRLPRGRRSWCSPRCCCDCIGRLRRWSGERKRWRNCEGSCCHMR
ncbi:unnamed protein product [Durusdinium trenchii]|uniref:Uncharacterized protein n=1 Tax=Durusdinium trenchii TaxID=1381693 RepID=A0ABP0IYI0_9DINO